MELWKRLSAVAEEIRKQIVGSSMFGHTGTSQSPFKTRVEALAFINANWMKFAWEGKLRGSLTAGATRR
jgi:hypothetical protein